MTRNFQGHMYRMAVLSMTLDPVPGCDMEKVLKMCLVHDLPESRLVAVNRRKCFQYVLL